MSSFSSRISIRKEANKIKEDNIIEEEDIIKAAIDLMDNRPILILTRGTEATTGDKEGTLINLIISLTLSRTAPGKSKISIR